MHYPLKSEKRCARRAGNEKESGQRHGHYQCAGDNCYDDGRVFRAQVKYADAPLADLPPDVIADVSDQPADHDEQYNYRYAAEHQFAPQKDSG